MTKVTRDKGGHYPSDRIGKRERNQTPPIRSLMSPEHRRRKDPTASGPPPGRNEWGTEMNSTFSDLAPTETDAAGIVGGAAFLDLGPIVTPLIAGIVTVLSLHID